MIASFIREHAPGYLAFRTRHGYRSEHEATSLRAFDRFVTDKKIAALSEIDSNLVLEYGTLLLQSIKPQTVNLRLGVLSHFFQYLERMDLCTSNPFADRVGFKALKFCPYVFSDAEVERILDLYADDVGRGESIRDVVSRLGRHCLLTIIAHCGLRGSEGCKLKVSDIDFQERTIFIENTKFRKDRKIPVSYFILDEIKNYMEARRLHPAYEASNYLFPGSKIKNSHYRLSSLEKPFAEKMRELGIWRKRTLRGDTVFGSATIHSFRHAFAVRTIRRWQRLGLPIDSIADTLSTYMGHVEFSSTQIYLKALSRDSDQVILYPNAAT